VKLLDRLRADAVLPGGSQLVVAGVARWGDPAMYERLLLRSRQGPAVVENQDDLVGRVVISSPQGALLYVRLFTTPGTAYCLEDATWYEVLPCRAVDDGLLVGRGAPPIEITARVKTPTGAWGVVTDAEWNKSRLRMPAISRENGAFVVRRALAKLSGQPSAAVSLVREVIWPDGRWERASETTTQLPSANLSLPVIP
jgi:hypothetical protein